MKKALTVLGLIGIGIAGRLVPHAPNATPITAITLAAQKELGRVWAFAVPLFAMLVSDAIIGFYNWKILLSVYVSFALIALMSMVLRKRRGLSAALIIAVLGSVVFFLVTNFTVWIFSPWYAKNVAGLLYCYELGLPFFRYMLLGDIVYSTAIIGAFTLAKAWMPVLNTKSALLIST